MRDIVEQQIVAHFDQIEESMRLLRDLIERIQNAVDYSAASTLPSSCA